MKTNLLGKTALIIAVLLVFLFGIFGIPKSLSAEGLKAAIFKRINLGLDLKGGTHLILQVQVADAVNAESDRVVERLKDSMKKGAIPFTEVSKPDPNAPEKVVIKGVPPANTSDLRNIVSEQMPEWDMASGADNSWTLTMKAQSLAALKNQAVAQAIETIRNRIDQLGVTEPVIQEHGLGQYQIVVQLLGVDDSGQVK